MRTSSIGWVALVSMALAIGTVGGACGGWWIADREWRECWAEIIRDREERARDLDDALGELAAESAELDRVRRERDDYRARYAVAQKELETRQRSRGAVVQHGSYIPPNDVISIAPTPEWITLPGVYTVQPHDSMRMGNGVAYTLPPDVRIRLEAGQ